MRERSWQGRRRRIEATGAEELDMQACRLARDPIPPRDPAILSPVLLCRLLAGGAIQVEEDVAGLDVVVDHPGTVASHERLGELHHDAGHSGLRDGRAAVEAVGKIDNCKFKFRTRFIMTRIKPSMHDSNILDSTYIINMISENMIMKQI